MRSARALISSDPELSPGPGNNDRSGEYEKEGFVQVLGRGVGLEIIGAMKSMMLVLRVHA